MNRRLHERGSALILLLGVVAALSVLTAALIMLLTNVQYATGKDRSRAKAFNVAEAGLDLGERALDQSWPTSSSPAPAALGTADLLALKDPDEGSTFLDSGEYPGLAASVTFFDNPDDDGNYPSGYSEKNPPTVDLNDDGMMYIRSVARVGGKTGAVQALVSKVEFEVNLPPDVVLYTEGNLTIQGTGSQDAVSVEPGDASSSATAYYDLDDYDLSGNPKSDPVNDDDTRSADSRSTSLEAVFPALADLIAEADSIGRAFADEDEFSDYSGQVGGVTYTGWSLVSRSQPHIVVIEDGDITLPDTTPGHDLYPSIWNEDEPGILIVPNGKVWIKGQTTFYGIIFCQDVFEGGGTPSIHGVVIAPGGARLHGDRALIYSSKVIFNLDRMMVDSVRVVPGTWRELRGVAAPAS
jgi:hypothetical protein